MWYLYKHLPDFKRYVDRHCRMYGVTVEEALGQALVKEVANAYIEKAIAAKHS